MQPEQTPKPNAFVFRPAPARLRFQVAAFTLARTILNTGYRMVYPFLPALSRGLGVPVESITLAITLRSSLGFFSPLLGSIGDVWGRKAAMLFGLILFAAGMLLVSLWPSYPSLFVALLLTAVSKIIYDPAVYAYLGDRVHYRQRGLAIGLTEFGWSGAFLLGIPVVGWLIAQAGWSSPFLLLGLLALAAAALIGRLVPSDSTPDAARPSLRQGIGIVLSHPAALAGLAIGVLISASNETVNIVFGLWMENAFGLQVVALGAASAVIGIAELVGEGFVAGFVDRLGKRRAVGIGLMAYALACLLLPTLGFSLEGALLGLFLFYLAFEFTLVSALPLMTELAPGARATLMAGNAAAHSLGRVLGSLLGPWLFPVGFQANAVAAVILNAIALIALAVFIGKEYDQKD